MAETAATSRKRWTAQGILTAAREVLEADGLDAFTMRAVAQRLGTGVASLYRHVRSRQELLDLLVDEALAGVVLPDRALPWRERLTRLAHAVRDVLLSQRDLPRVAMTSSTVSPHSRRIAEEVLDALVAAGCDPELASLALDRLSLYVTADAFETSLQRAQMSDREAARHWRAVAEAYAQLDPAAFPQLVAHADVISRAAAEERFAAGLAMLLDGIAARIGARGQRVG